MHSLRAGRCNRPYPTNKRGGSAGGREGQGLRPLRVRRGPVQQSFHEHNDTQHGLHDSSILTNALPERARSGKISSWRAASATANITPRLIPWSAPPYPQPTRRCTGSLLRHATRSRPCRATNHLARIGSNSPSPSSSLPRLGSERSTPRSSTHSPRSSPRRKRPPPTRVHVTRSARAGSRCLLRGSELAWPS